MLSIHLLLGQQLQLFLQLKKVSQLTVKECILTFSPKSCDLDPIPSKLLIECLDSVLPSLNHLFNSSLKSGIFPQCFKSTLVTPILKKRCFDQNNLNNYRPVSNLCVIAKILEKPVLFQISPYPNSLNLYNICKSAYRPETALLKIVNLFLSLNKAAYLYLPCSLYLIVVWPLLLYTQVLLRVQFMALCFSP